MAVKSVYIARVSGHCIHWSLHLQTVPDHNCSNMAFTGKYEVTSQENYEDFMKVLSKLYQFTLIVGSKRFMCVILHNIVVQVMVPS